jgi:hypothetical protein
VRRRRVGDRDDERPAGSDSDDLVWGHGTAR